MDIGNKGISPLIATVLLIAFSVALGAVVMSWGETYIEEKAQFVEGNQGLVNAPGCDGISLAPIILSGKETFCIKDAVIKTTLENKGVNTANNLKITAIGADGVQTKEGVISKELKGGDAVKIEVPFDSTGLIKQIKIIPFYDGKVCPDKSLVRENIENCGV